MSGIIILPVFIIYTVIGFFILKSVLKVFNKKLNTLLLLTIVILLPFWDLFLQKGIKTYYELFLLNPIVYEQPIRDKDGKIESFDFSENEIDKRSLKNNVLYTTFFKGISNFVDVYIIDYENDKKKELVRLDIKTKTFKYIPQATARYIIDTSFEYKFILFGLAKTAKTRIIDRTNNKVIMENSRIIFTDKYTFFRRNVLFLVSGASQRDLFKVSRLYSNKLTKKLKLKLKY